MRGPHSRRIDFVDNKSVVHEQLASYSVVISSIQYYHSNKVLAILYSVLYFFLK